MGYRTGDTRGNEIGLLDGLMTNRAMRRYTDKPVSYTHLTLPTICSV